MSIQDQNDMKNCILYYPTINVPNRVWVRNSLLYWDEIASIVPSNIEDTEFSVELCVLKDAGYFRPLSPQNFLNRMENYNEIEQFASEFFDILKSPKFKHLLKQKYKPRFVVNSGIGQGFYRVESALLDYEARVHDDKIQRRGSRLPSELEYTSRVSNDKLTYSVIDKLREMNLISEFKEDDWWRMESITALVYMSLLAKYMADVDEHNTIPGTSNSAYEDLIFMKAGEGNQLPVYNLCLANILPMPKSSVKIEKIIDFKNNASRMKELHKFQSVLSTMQNDLSNTHNEHELKHLVNKFKKDIQIGVEGLSDVLNESRIETTLGGVKNLIGIKPLAEGSVAAIGLNKLTEEFNLNINPTLIGMTAAAVIEVGHYYIQRRNQRNNALRNSPYSYLYHLKYSGLI